MATDRSGRLLAAAVLLTLLAAGAPGFLARGGADSDAARDASRTPGLPAGAEPVRDAPPLPPPEAVAALFGWKPPAAPEPASPAPPPRRKEEPRADRLRPLGQVETEEGLYLFLKDLRSGRVFRVPMDGTPEDGAALDGSDSEVYRIRYGDELHTVPRRP